MASRSAIGLLAASVERQVAGGVGEFGERHDRPHRAEPVQLGGGDLLAGEEHLPRLVPPDEQRQVRAGAEQPDVDLGRAERALSEAMRMSQHAANARPAPSAGPLIAPMTGTAQSVIAHIASRASRGGSVTSDAGISSPRSRGPTDFRSTPAMNARSPAAVKTATRTSRSSANPENTSMISANVPVSPR